jgi:hypothetical protein
MMKCENAFPGYNSKTLLDNFFPQYMLKGESKPGYKADGEREVAQDATVRFIFPKYFFRFFLDHFFHFNGYLFPSCYWNYDRDQYERYVSGH